MRRFILKPKENELVLYGLDKYEEAIDKVINDLNAFEYYFDIKLILTEALTNAFYHGNDKDKNKPIYLKYYYECSNVVFEIKDSGVRLKDTIEVPEQVYNEDLLKEHGRGLFLLRCFADKTMLTGNTLIIKKNIKVE